MGTFNASTLVEGKGGRIAELNDHLDSRGVDICLLQETALKMKHVNIKFNSYDLIREDRIARLKGGVAILFKKGIVYRLIPMHRIISFQSIECTGIVLNLPGGEKIFVISIYNKKQRNAIGQDLSSILSVLRLDALNHHFIFGGDFYHTINNEFLYKSSTGCAEDTFVLAIKSYIVHTGNMDPANLISTENESKSSRVYPFNLNNCFALMNGKYGILGGISDCK